MKVLTWNIQQGGSIKRLPKISEVLIRHAADIIVLTEYRKGKKGDALQEELKAVGYQCLIESSATANQNGILIASKTPLQPKESTISDVYSDRWVEVSIPAFDIELLGIHIPTSNSALQPDYW